MYLALPSFKHVHRIWYKLIPSSFNWFIGLSQGISSVKFLDYSYTNPHKKNPHLHRNEKLCLIHFYYVFDYLKFFFGRYV